eukprot:TRINITY_DN10834_c0_g1_i1.p1 TRINITY_DN10834_c0_g1~~TRINITY_DN10834_c0_g1_i1.p1  ORF type:complete len:456 (-),score=74.04 TRINITY_DN10834_c0_g1_i1:114-1481(-)
MPGSVETSLDNSVEAYLAKLLRGEKIETRETPGKGRCLYASAPPASMEPPVVFAEMSPLGRIVQTALKSGCRGRSCFLCGHTLGSPKRQLQLLTGLVTPIGYSGDDEVLEEPLSDVVSGRPLWSKRKTLFCSSSCLEEFERTLGRLRPRTKAARRFAKFARKCDNPFHLLALKLLCWALAEAERTTATAAALPLKALCRRPYWDAVDMPKSAEKVHKFRSKLIEETEHSRLLALEALGGKTVIPKGWDFLEPRGYAELLGALCNNATAVVYVSPVLQHILQVDGMKDCPKKSAAVACLVPWLRALQAAPCEPQDDSDADEAAGDDEERLLVWDTSEGQFEFSTSLIPPFRGYAIYPRMALMNHSCSPTCAIEFTFSGGLFVLKQGDKAIEKGTELTISYLDSSLDADDDHLAMGYKQRRKQLRPYGFECCCQMCKIQSEASAKVQTSRKRRRTSS